MEIVHLITQIGYYQYKLQYRLELKFFSIVVHLRIKLLGLTNLNK